MLKSENYFMEMWPGYWSIPYPSTILNETSIAQAENERHRAYPSDHASLTRNAMSTAPPLCSVRVVVIGAELVRSQVVVLRK